MATVTATSSGLDLPLTAPVWSDAMVAAAGLRAEQVPFVTIGGGLASFAVVDALRVRGLRASQIRVVSPERHPYGSLRRLVTAGQILDREPLRSDSASRADNIWGFPGYALEEAIRRRRPRPLWTVLTEPVAAEYYSPSPGQVFRGLDREAARIGWDSMLAPGRAEIIRRRAEGGFFCLIRPLDDCLPYLLCGRYLHLATGYPALGYTPELREYRRRYREYFKVMNAYDPHEHVYQVLRRRAGTVAVRGAGITASRILQRLIDDRDLSGQDVRILHLFRDYAERSGGRRGRGPAAGDGWRFQPFSFPKSAAAGQIREELASMGGTERAARITALGRTTTARRRRWQRQLRDARSAGYYRTVRGEVTAIEPTRDRRVRLLATESGTGRPLCLTVDFLLDCTGLNADLCESPLLADLIDHGGAAGNALGGLDVGPSFEVRGSGGEPGRLYASGVIARGGDLAPADSFLGFVDAAVRISDDLAVRGLCSRLGPAGSVAGWAKWLAGRAP